MYKRQLGRFARTTFVSFWGQFGWMAAPLPGWMVGGLLGLTAVAALGLLLAVVQARGSRGEGEQGSQERAILPAPEDADSATRHSSFVTRRSSLVLGLTFLLTLGLHIAYNLTFVQHQGRYLYPALIPIAVGFVAGLGFWLRPLVRRWPRSEWLLPLGIAGLLVGVALFALWRIIPGLAP